MTLPCTLWFLDRGKSRTDVLPEGDSLYNHGEKPGCWKPSGLRVKHGLYKSRDGHVINADCNGAANIAKKVATQLGISLAEVGRASLTVPQRIDLFSRLSKSYRKRCYGVF